MASFANSQMFSALPHIILGFLALRWNGIFLTLARLENASRSRIETKGLRGTRMFPGEYCEGQSDLHKHSRTDDCNFLADSLTVR